MRIGIDARFLTHPQRGGFKSYTENLISALAEVDSTNQYILYLDRIPDRNSNIPKKPNFLHRIVPGTFPMLGMVWREQVRLPRQAFKDRLDLVHSPCLSAPLYMNCPSVVTIHDMIWYYPKKYSGNSNGPISARRKLQDWYYRIIPVLAARNVTSIITVSQTSKDLIVTDLKLPSDKVFVTYEASSNNFRRIPDRNLIKSVRKKYDLTSEFILALGSADPRKNIDTLLEAYALLPLEIREKYQLVIVWNNGYLTASMEQLIDKLGLNDQVKFLEWISNEDLVLIYNAASLFVFPSLNEGFGLPILEAMACGIPVVAGNNSSIPEVTENAALLTDARDAGKIAKSISYILTNESVRSDYTAKGLKRAAYFSWSKCALQTIEVYKKVIESHELARTGIERSTI